MARRLPSTDDREHHASRSPLVRACARLADSTPFNVGIFAVILANAVVLGLETYDGVERRAGGALEALDTVFLGIFVVELAIRVVAHGSRPGQFLRSGWNVFDLVVVASAFVPGLRENATLLRLVRLARVLRVVRLLPELRVLMLAVGRSVPGVASLGVLGIVLVFVYGMVGWVLFGDALPDDYGNIGEAMLTLGLLLSLEGLPEQMATGQEVTAWAVPFYISFMLVAALLLLNILIGVVLTSMEEAREIEDARIAAERAEHGEPETEVALVERVAEARRALDELERALRDGAPPGSQDGARDRAGAAFGAGSRAAGGVGEEHPATLGGGPVPPRTARSSTKR